MKFGEKDSKVFLMMKRKTLAYAACVSNVYIKGKTNLNDSPSVSFPLSDELDFRRELAHQRFFL